MPRRKNKNSPNKLCGPVTFKNIKRNNNPYLYFVIKFGEQDKSWAPHICCTT